jgi:hypothetical protein
MRYIFLDKWDEQEWKKLGIFPAELCRMRQEMRRSGKSENEGKKEECERYGGMRGWGRDGWMTLLLGFQWWASTICMVGLNILWFCWPDIFCYCDVLTYCCSCDIYPTPPPPPAGFTSYRAFQCALFPTSKSKFNAKNWLGSLLICHLVRSIEKYYCSSETCGACHLVPATCAPCPVKIVSWEVLGDHTISTFSQATGILTKN